MNKGLIALQKICERFPLNPTSDLIMPIEEELKRLEKIETTTHSVLREDISKKLEALQTLKTMFDINVFEFQGGYFLSLGISKPVSISKEKYDLLKEAIL